MSTGKKVSPGLEDALGRAIEAIKSSTKSELPLKRGSFLKKAWNTFDLTANLEILLDPRPSFFAHKAVVLGGGKGQG